MPEYVNVIQMKVPTLYNGINIMVKKHAKLLKFKANYTMLWVCVLEGEGSIYMNLSLNFKIPEQ